MHVGIITRYKQHEATLAAIRMAEWVRAYGADITMVTYDKPGRNPVNAYWDANIKRLPQGAFPKWSSPFTSIVWTHEPSIDEITWAHYKQVLTAIVAPWDELSSEFDQVFQLCTAIIAPSMLAGEFFLSRGFAHTLPVPWDPGLPLTQKPDEYEPGKRLKVLLPLHDSQTSRVRPDTVKVLTKVLRTCTWVDLTILGTASKLRGKLRYQIRQLERAVPGRVTHVPDPGGERRWLIYAKHDLTIWLSTIETFGLPGLISLAMGTPVIGYGAPTISEILAPSRSRRMPGRVLLNAEGVPHFIPNLDRTEEHLLALLADRDEIQRMATNTNTGYRRRSESFDNIWPFILK